MPFTDNDSFCGIADVEAHVGRGALSASTRPTADQAQKFMHDRAMQIQARLFEAGHPYTVPSGSAPLPYVSDTDKTIKDLANAANAYLAAGDVVRAREVRDAPETPSDAEDFWRQGNELLDSLIQTVQTQVTDASARTATSTGGIAKQSFSETGFDAERSRSELFGLDRKW